MHKWNSSVSICNGILQLLSNEMKAVFVTALVFSSFSFIMAQTLTWTMTQYDDAACQRQSSNLPLSGASGVCMVAGNQGGSYNCDGTNFFKKMYRVGGGDCSGPFTIEDTTPLNTCRTTSSGYWRTTCKNPVSSGNAITITSLSVVVAVLSLCL
jgi:hypothetical protein